jgi:hypothetical protein
MSKKFCTFVGMKKNKKSNQFLINRFSLFGLGGGLLLLFMFFNGVAKGQVLTVPSQFHSASYEISNADNVVKTPKILKYTDSLHIVLYNAKTFCLLTFGNTSRTTLVNVIPFYTEEREGGNISITGTINDFAILGDTLYFCGYFNQNVYESEPWTYTRGYIAYISIADLFNNQVSVCNYSIIPSVTNVKRIEAYYNNTNARMIVGIGEQFYGDVIIPPMDDANLDQNLPPFGDDTYGKGKPNDSHTKTVGPFCYTDTLKMYDCFISYKVEEINSYNKFDIYRCHYAHHSNLTDEDRLSDITVTDDYVCLVSYCNEDYLILRKLDKNNFANRVTKLLRLSYKALPSDKNPFQLEHLRSNEIALCLTGYETSNLSRLFATVHTIDLNTFTNLSSQRIYDNGFQDFLYSVDFGYNLQDDKIYLLANKSYASTITAMQRIAPVPNNGSPFYQGDLYLSFNYTNDLYNNILMIDDYYGHFAYVGNNADKLLLREETKPHYYHYCGENHAGEFEGCCYLEGEAIEPVVNPAILISNCDLVHCSFAISNGLIMVTLQNLPVQVQILYFEKPSTKNGQINTICNRNENL